MNQRSRRYFFKQAHLAFEVFTFGNRVKGKGLNNAFAELLDHNKKDERQ